MQILEFWLGLTGALQVGAQRCGRAGLRKVGFTQILAYTVPHRARGMVSNERASPPTNHTARLTAEGICGLTIPGEPARVYWPVAAGGGTRNRALVSEGFAITSAPGVYPWTDSCVVDSAAVTGASAQNG